MSYVQKVLLPGERVIYETGLHWLVFARAVVILLVAAVLAVGSLYAPTDTTPVLLALAGAVGVIGLLFLVAALLRRAGTELAVTDQRVVVKRGLIARHTIEMNRSKVESVDVDQPLLGRILGYGTVQVRGTGGSLEPMPLIAAPLTFRSHITAEPVLAATSG